MQPGNFGKLIEALNNVTTVVVAALALWEKLVGNTMAMSMTVVVLFLLVALSVIWKK